MRKMTKRMIIKSKRNLKRPVKRLRKSIKIRKTQKVIKILKRTILNSLSLNAAKMTMKRPASNKRTWTKWKPCLKINKENRSLLKIWCPNQSHWLNQPLLLWILKSISRCLKRHLRASLRWLLFRLINWPRLKWLLRS